MKDSLIVGLDLGTTLCKAVAFQMDGSQCALSQQTVRTFRPMSGEAEQDPNEWTEHIVSVLADLVTQLGNEARRISVIGVSAHGPSLILTDEHFSPLGHCTIWQDQRAAHLCGELLDKAGAGWVGLGMPESSFGIQLYWALKNQPTRLQEARHIFDTKGFILATLTGTAVDEPSSSPGGKEWNRQLFEILGVDTNKLPDTVESDSLAGYLRREVCERTGLPLGLPVIAGLNDGASATLGAGLLEVGQGIVSLSTNGVMRTTISQRLPGETLVQRSMFCYSYVEGMFVTGGTTKCGGDSVRWFIETFMAGYPLEEKALFDLIAEDAAKSPMGANSVVFMPYLVGTGSPNSREGSQGAFLNLGRHNKRSDLTRALLEGTAFALRDIAESFNEMELLWDNLRFTGGGSKNTVWRQIVADVLGQPLDGVRSDSTLGAAIIAAVGIGLYPSPHDAVEAMVHKTFHTEPDDTSMDFYDQEYQRFRRIRPLLDEFNKKQS